ncbi:MAG: radical SAM protein [Ruminococcaceae bacterium]|nr:radical SAM protein [Oscillospiraceae bacterium]
MTEYRSCMLCPRECGVDRSKAKGYCGMTDKLILARAALHFWEEPCISGERGSGTVFFSGCNMRCIYCQNHNIALGNGGRELSLERLCEIYHELREKGAHNINLVTATHYIPHIIKSIEKVKSEGFDLPFVYNTSSYESVSSLKRLEGLIDVYLPDFKYALSADAKKYSNASDYPEKALSAIDEMVRQVPLPVIEKGIMKKGVIIRHLLLPGKVIESKIALKKLYERYGNRVYYSIMSQYTPLRAFEDCPELNRRVTENEYRSLCGYAVSLGIKNAFVQDGESAAESFIPEFNGEGL